MLCCSACEDKFGECPVFFLAFDKRRREKDSDIHKIIDTWAVFEVCPVEE